MKCMNYLFFTALGVAVTTDAAVVSPVVYIPLGSNGTISELMWQVEIF